MNRKIKIAHIISRMISGGAEEDVLQTIEGLDKKKYSIDLIVGDDCKEEVFQKSKEIGFQVIQVNGLKGKLDFLWDPIVLIKLLVILRKRRYDIVNTHTTKSGILGRIAAKVAGIPIIICRLHGTAIDTFSNYSLNCALMFFERLISQYTDAFISVSRLLSEQYIRRGIGSMKNHYIVYTGIKLDKFFNARNKMNREDLIKEINIEPRSFIMGMIGRLEKAKGHKYLLDALTILKEKRKNINLILLIVGEGEEKENLVKYSINIGLEKNVIFTGYRTDIEKIMGMMDIFILSSLREGLPRVLVQAAAVGLPSVAFNVDGVPEIVKDGINGFLVEPKNVNELAEKIVKYIDDRDLIKSHGRNGQNFVKGKWSIEEMVSRVDNIYKELIREKMIK